MITRLRLLVVLARPAVVTLLALFAATGLAQSGASREVGLLALALAPVTAFLLFAVLVNDLADEHIDRINVPTDSARPLLATSTWRSDMRIAAIVAAIVAMATSFLLPFPAPLVVAGGLAVAAAYSLPPLRLAKRGAVAAMVLPAGYVAVPYLLGLLAGRGSNEIHRVDLLVLAALYVGFIGGIVLKDFRDVKGDALFGKRTFLVRHGRTATCAFSAVCWVGGLAVVPVLRGADLGLAASHGVLVVLALCFLAKLAREPGRRMEDNLISAIAIVGRGLALTVITHLSMVDAGWSTAARLAMLAPLTLLVVGTAHNMARHGAARSMPWAASSVDSASLTPATG